MSSTRELRHHIRSIRSTRQITKAMELVASSKMRRAVSSTLASRPYFQHAIGVIQHLKSMGKELTHPLLTARPIKIVTLFVIASDRGLAGAYNALLSRSALEFVREHRKEGHTIHIITMGRKVESTLRNAGLKSEQNYEHSSAHPEPAEIIPISHLLTNLYRHEKSDAVFVLYTDYQSALKQQAVLKQLLPLSAADFTQGEEEIISDTEFLYEPSPEIVLDYVLPRVVEAELFQYLQESLASEHAARRLAMSNASENASSLIDKLQLTYNSVRQSSITQEIAEITGGAAALEY